MRRILELHRDFQCDPVGRLEVEAARPAPGMLALRYVLTGQTARLHLPAPAEPVRADELWRRTCFEAFVGDGAGQAYLEINLAPSAAWAAYGFSGYRDGMRVAEEAPAPRFDSARADDRYELSAILDLGATALRPGATWRLAISAVIEAADGARSYWALAHPPGKPDFHHPESFVLELAPPEGP
jgi:hypothetical protein